MGLDGSGFLALVALLTAAAFVGTLVLWRSLRGWTAVHHLRRALLLLGCQALAVLLAVVAINDQYGFYTSWDDLLGTTSAGVARPYAPAGFAQHDGAGPLAFRPLPGGWQQATLAGPQSGLTGTVDVWLPPQYHSPQYAGHRFPVVELLHGVPGQPSDWIGNLDTTGTLTAAVSAGTSEPFILVAPDITFGGQDTMCSDAPGAGPKIDTWLTLDVRTAIQSTLRASASRDGWGLLGYSTGGLCASKLALQHAGEYRAAVSIAGDAANTSTLLDQQQRDENSPLWLAANRPAPEVALLLAASRADDTTAADAQALAAAVRPPTAVSLMIQPDGGHNPDVWNGMLPGAWSWLSRLLPG
ncbi:alpha/beta hydrolase [Kitasatospora mediocidica]|uniref:alpha/beta hydrolase n=1 Tax=Kitasatospora mediocidica TaxID=58352 RepID=UPI00055D9ED7|nr:alpha/beta hydrolase-fold protein [Kitasatospora mediocidica]